MTLNHFARIADGAVDVLVVLAGYTAKNGTLGKSDSEGHFTADPNYPGSWVDVTALPSPPQIGSGYAAGVFTPPAPPPSSPAIAAQALYRAGCAIVSAGTQTVNGTYALAGQAWRDMKDEAQFVSTFGAFSTGTPTLPWTLADGKTAIVFPSTASFLAVVKALGQTLSAIKQFAAGQAAQLPAQPVNIA